MMRQPESGGRLARLLLALVLALQSACATRSPTPSEPLPRRETAGAVALGVSERAPTLALEPATSTKGEGAAKGAGGGTLLALGVCALGYPIVGTKEPYGTIVWAVVCATFFIAAPLVGGISGAHEARPKSETSEARQIIADAVRTAAPAAALRDALAAVAAQHPERAARVLPGEPSLSMPPEREALVADGFDSVIVLEASDLALTGSGIDPPMALQVTVRARRYALPGGELIDEGVYRAEGKPRKYSVWAANNAAALREELARALDDIAAQILDSLPPAKTSPKQ